MKLQDFDRIYKFISRDKTVYFLLLKKNNDIVPSEETKAIVNYLKEFPSLFLSPNINTYNKGSKVALFSFPKSGLGNCIIVRLETLAQVIDKLNLDLESLLAKKSVLKKSVKSLRKQEARYREKKKRVGEPNQSDVIVYGNTNNSLSRWAEKNKVSANKSITKFENIVYNALKKTFKNRIKRQQPFVIDGNVYYADFCIKSKKVIIEIDGGYHLMPSQIVKDKDRDASFRSIGYEVIRITNSQTTNDKVLKDLRARLITMSKR